MRSAWWGESGGREPGVTYRTRPYKNVGRQESAAGLCGVFNWFLARAVRGSLHFRSVRSHPRRPFDLGRRPNAFPEHGVCQSWASEHRDMPCTKGAFLRWGSAFSVGVRV